MLEIFVYAFYHSDWTFAQFKTCVASRSLRPIENKEQNSIIFSGINAALVM